MSQVVDVLVVDNGFNGFGTVAVKPSSYVIGVLEVLFQQRGKAATSKVKGGIVQSPSDMSVIPS